MGLTIEYVLALFTLLAVSSGVFFLAKRTKIPYTVLLVAVGTFILVPLSKVAPFAFLDDFILTPELLFYIFLPTLIFESAYNMDIRRVAENIHSISLLAVVGLLISAGFIAVGLMAVFNLVGITIPFIVALLFGALISATDPVAVLALFKEVGAPRRLSLIFEGESIFNDGTAVALFLIVLSIVLSGYEGIGSLMEGLLMFAAMVIGGILMGLIMGGGFAKLVGYARGNEFVQITLTIVLAHFTFISTEMISHQLVIGDLPIHLSAIIATAIASMVMGNYGRAKISPHAEEFIEKFWGQFAFIANSLVFILIGLIFSNLPFKVTEFIVPVGLAVVVVAVGRALSIYPVIGFLNWTKSEAPIPRAWQHLLAWGSLRGALAITMVLLIPEDLALAGWTYEFSPRDFILALTIGCIYATLFIKATTISYFIRRLGLDAPTDIEKLEHDEARAIVHTTVLSRLEDFRQKGYIDAATYETLRREHEMRFRESWERCKSQTQQSGQGSLADRVLRMYAIGIERHYLKELYAYGEIDEKVYKRILGKLTIQKDRLDRGEPDGNASQFIDTKDLFEQLANFIRRIFFPSHLTITPEEQYTYYRAQSIIARKVLKELTHLESIEYDDVFGKETFERTKERYATYRMQSQAKMDQIVHNNPLQMQGVSELLARKGILKVEEAVLEDLFKKEMITPKIHIAIRDEIEHEAERVEVADRS